MSLFEKLKRWAQPMPSLPPMPEPGEDVVPFTKDEVRKYLTDAVDSWRKVRDENELGSPQQEMAVHYIDAFQSVHISLFGWMVPM